MNTLEDVLHQWQEFVALCDEKGIEIFEQRGLLELFDRFREKLAQENEIKKGELYYNLPASTPLGRESQGIFEKMVENINSVKAG